MRIWIDADACPGPVKGHRLPCCAPGSRSSHAGGESPALLPPSPLITAIQAGFDEADHVLAQQAESGDLVITADIPLAARLVARGIAALNPRGEAYSAKNIQERLALRDLKEALRSAGTTTGGSAALPQPR